MVLQEPGAQVAVLTQQVPAWPGVVVAQLPRASELCRPDARGVLKPVAANIDRILVVIAPRPEPHANLLDRYLVAAETLGIEAIIVLNKADLLDAESD